MNKPGWVRMPRPSRWLVVSAAGLLPVACVAVPSAVFWDWNWLSGGESGSTTIRNLGLVAGGFIAIAVAVWRTESPRVLRRLFSLSLSLCC